MITKLYAQTDSRWAKDELGYNTDPSFDIGNYGCLVTAYGNMLYAITGDAGYTPAMVNDWMKQQQGFVAGGGEFIWPVALGMGHVTASDITTELSAVNAWIQDPPNFAILEVRASGGRQHFVMAPYVNKIVDSEDGLLKNMGTYPFVNARLYKSLDPINEPVAPVAAPKSGTATVTAELNGKSTFLNLRTGPGVNFLIGTGKDDAGNTIHSIPFGVKFEYVDVVQANPNSAVQGLWLVTDRKNYVAAAGTNYQG